LASNSDAKTDKFII